MPIYIFKINIFEIKVPSYHMQHISFFTSPVRHSFLIANSFPVLPIVIIDILEMRSIKQNHMIILLVFHKQPQLHLLQLCFHSFRPYSITVKNEMLQQQRAFNERYQAYKFWLFSRECSA